MFLVEVNIEGIARRKSHKLRKSKWVEIMFRQSGGISVIWQFLSGFDGIHFRCVVGGGKSVLWFVVCVAYFKKYLGKQCLTALIKIKNTIIFHKDI